jgi:hypothetical protein
MSLGRSRILFGIVTTALFVGPAIVSATATGTPAAASPAPAASTGEREPLCDAQPYRCVDPGSHKNEYGEYVGHDEPAVAFYSNTPGSGSQQNYKLTLPRDSKVLPVQNGTGGVWNFQLRPTFWLGLALCDNQSAPNFTHAPCKADSDTNIFDNTDPSAPDWIGHHPGGAFMEMQFYPPGWVPWPDGISCSATQWCAALNIDSLNTDDLHGIDNNSDCLDKVGDEPVNFAFITKNGQAHAPAGPLENSPLTSTQPALTFNPKTDMVMNPGDQIGVDIRDTSGGLRVTLHDFTSGAVGSMTAGPSNGFAQVMFNPTANRCKESPYTFHPMYATSSPHTRLEWTAHTLNVSVSDEIGHFEYCNAVKSDGTCKGGNATDKTTDDDDDLCLPGSEALLVKVTGCVSSADDDFDGPSYLKDWPGTGAAPNKTSEPLRFTSPTSGGAQYSQVAFETDLLALDQVFGFCGSDVNQCKNPPKSGLFYPMFTTGTSSMSACEWREGGPSLPNTTNTFGGSSGSEFGKPEAVAYPVAPNATGAFYEDFYRVLSNNPCKQ